MKQKIEITYQVRDYDTGRYRQKSLTICEEGTVAEVAAYAMMLAVKDGAEPDRNIIYKILKAES